MKRKTLQSGAANDNLEETGGSDDGVDPEAVGEDVSVPESDIAAEDESDTVNQLEPEQDLEEAGSRYENPAEETSCNNSKEDELDCDEHRAEDETEDIEQQSLDDADNTDSLSLKDDKTEEIIEGVVENPLFSPENCPEPGPIESFSMAGAEDDLDFEPEIDENEATKSSAAKESSWLDNVASPGKVGDEDEKNVTIDEIVISDTDDIDALGDKIDAAYPGSKNTDTIDDEDSDEEKRGWRSEKPKAAASESSTRSRRRSPPVRRRRVSPPVGRSSRPRRRSRSSSIEIVSVRSQSGSPPKVVKRREILPTGRYLSRSRSRERYRRRSLTPPRSGLTQLREEREKTARVRRQVEDLRDMMGGGGGGGGRGYDDDRGVKSRLGKSAPSKTRGHKLIVKNFPKSLSDSEFYSMFVRRGELLSCEKKNNIGFVVYKTREGANNAVSALNGSKNGNLTLSVKEAPAEREVIQPSPRERYQDPPLVAPPPPTGIFSRLGSHNNTMSPYSREPDFPDSDRYDSFVRSDRPQQMMTPADLRLNNQMQSFGRYQEPDFAERYDSFPMRSQDLMDREDERFHNDMMQERMQMHQSFDRFKQPDFGDPYSRSYRSQGQMMDQDDERFHDEMMQEDNEMMGAYQDRMGTRGNNGRMSGSMFNMFSSGRNVNMMGEMTGTIRGTMGDFMGEKMGGNFRGAEVGGMRTANIGVEPGQSFGETFRSGGGNLSYSDRNFSPASSGPRYSQMMRDQEDYSSSGDRDLRPSARAQFGSTSGHFVIGGGHSSSNPGQSDSFSRGSFARSNPSQRPSFGSIGSSRGRGGGGSGHTTWSN